MEKFLKRIIILNILTGILSHLCAQVNTEALRKTELTNGIYNTLSSDFGFQSGNSEYLTLNGELRIDVVRNAIKSFFVVNYKRGTEAKELFVNKGFAHLRGMYTLNETYTLETFLQKEFNDFIELKDRNLIGGGVRMVLLRSRKGEINGEEFSRIYWAIGIGAMWENEEIEVVAEENTNLIRSTNYISLNWQIDKRLNFTLISYFQPALRSFSDFRILSEGSMGFNLTRAVIFKTTVSLRSDNEPPRGIKKHDLELTNGLSVSL